MVFLKKYPVCKIMPGDFQVCFIQFPSEETASRIGGHHRFLPFFKKKNLLKCLQPYPVFSLYMMINFYSKSYSCCSYVDFVSYFFCNIFWEHTVPQKTNIANIIDSNPRHSSWCSSSTVSLNAIKVIYSILCLQYKK